MNEYLLIHPARAHSGEEEEAPIGATDYAGPILAILIIVAAVFIARRIRKGKTYESDIDTP